MFLFIEQLLVNALCLEQSNFGNDLPDHIKSQNNMRNTKQFKTVLRTYLFKQFYNDSSVLLILSALKSWLQLILAKYHINGNYSSYITATSTKLAIIIVRASVNKLQHFVAMETVT